MPPGMSSSMLLRTRWAVGMGPAYIIAAATPADKRRRKRPLPAKRRAWICADRVDDSDDRAGVGCYSSWRSKIRTAAIAPTTIAATAVVTGQPNDIASPISASRMAGSSPRKPYRAAGPQADNSMVRK